MKQLIYPFIILMCLSICLSSNAQWLDVGTGITQSDRTIWSISPVDKQTIWAYASHSNPFSEPTFEITRTTNGGNTWHPTIMSGIDSLFYVVQIFAINDSIAWVTTADELNPISGKVYKTTDGGNNWVEQSTGFTGFNETPAGIHFWDVNEGVAFGATGFDNYSNQISIYTTEDGGDNWTKVEAADMPKQLVGEGMWVSGGNNFFDVVGDNVWFVTNGTRIFHSADRGKTWEAQETNVASTFVNSVAFRDEMNGLALLASPDELVRTSDGGSTWQSISPPSQGPLLIDMEYVPFTNGSYIIHDGFVGDDTKLFITYDSGDNWELMETNKSFTTLQFLSRSIGFGGGDITNSSEGGMFRWNGDPFTSTSNVISQELSLSPNPTNQFLQIQNSAFNGRKLPVNIFNIYGNVVFSTSVFNEELLDLKNLNAGIFMLEVIDGDQIYVSKFIKHSTF